MSTLHSAYWRALGATAPKPSRPTPEENQDAFGGWSSDPPILLAAAVSDGHGSAKYVRSRLGAMFGVESFREVCKEGGIIAGGNRAEFRPEELAQRVVRRWRQKVFDHIEANALAEAESRQIAGANGAEAVDQIQNNILVTYGTTLLGCVVTEEVIACFQLGDGVIIGVDSAGKAAFATRAEGQVGDETYSLSMAEEDCVRLLRGNCRVFRRDDPAMPVLLLLATDGFSNSFKNDEGLLQAGEDYWRLLAAGQPAKEVVARSMADWLKESARASGDDATICICFQGDAVPTRSRPTRREQTTKLVTGSINSGDRTRSVPFLSVGRVV